MKAKPGTQSPQAPTTRSSAAVVGCALDFGLRVRTPRWLPGTRRHRLVLSFCFFVLLASQSCVMYGCSSSPLAIRALVTCFHRRRPQVATNAAGRCANEAHCMCHAFNLEQPPFRKRRRRCAVIPRVRVARSVSFALAMRAAVLTRAWHSSYRNGFFTSGTLLPSGGHTTTCST